MTRRAKKRTWSCCLQTCILLGLASGVAHSPSPADGSSVCFADTLRVSHRQLTVMPGDVTPAPFQITDTDKRGLIVVTAGCTLAFVWVCFVIRVWMRLQVREWRSDDYFLAAATVSLELGNLAAAQLLIIRPVPRHSSDWHCLSSRQFGHGRSSGRNTFGPSPSHWGGASDTLARFRLLPQRPSAGQPRPTSLGKCLTTTTARFRLSDLLYTHIMDDQVLHLAAVYAAVAQRRAQDCIVDYDSFICRVGTCLDHTHISPVQSCAILHEQSWKMR